MKPVLLAPLAEPTARRIAALLLWLTPPWERERWQAHVWRRLDSSRPMSITRQPSVIYVIYQWGDEPGWRDRWTLATWTDVRAFMWRDLARVWRDALYDALWQPVVLRWTRPLTRTLRRWCLLARGIHCDALTINGAPCGGAGERAITLSYGTGMTTETVTYCFCPTHEAALYGVGAGPLRFRDGTALHTAAMYRLRSAGADDGDGEGAGAR